MSRHLIMTWLGPAPRPGPHLPARGNQCRRRRQRDLRDRSLLGARSHRIAQTRRNTKKHPGFKICAVFCPLCSWDRGSAARIVRSGILWWLAVLPVPRVFEGMKNNSKGVKFFMKCFCKGMKNLFLGMKKGRLLQIFVFIPLRGGNEMRVERRQGSCHVCTGRIRAIVGRQVETLRSQFFACIQNTLRE